MLRPRWRRSALTGQAMPVRQDVSTQLTPAVTTGVRLYPPRIGGQVQQDIEFVVKSRQSAVSARRRIQQMARFLLLLDQPLGRPS